MPLLPRVAACIELQKSPLVSGLFNRLTLNAVLANDLNVLAFVRTVRR